MKKGKKEEKTEETINKKKEKVKDKTKKEKKKKQRENEIINIKSVEPILTKEITTKWIWITRIGAILAILTAFFTTGFIIIDRLFSNLEINSKIVSFASEHSTKFVLPTINGAPRDFQGQKYFIKISINVLNKDLNFSDLQVLVRFESDKKEYQGMIYHPRHFKEWNINDAIHILELPEEDLLYYKTTLEKDKTNLEYLTFIIPDTTNKFIDPNTLQLKDQYKYPLSIQLKFISSKKSFLKKENKPYFSNKMTIKELTYEKYIWEDEIWVKK